MRLFEKLLRKEQSNGKVLPHGIDDEGKQPKKRVLHLNIDDEFIAYQDEQAIIEPLRLSVNLSDGEARYEQDMARFSKPQRYWFAVDMYTVEVTNGGHDQFYYNSAGTVWEDAVAGLEGIGASKLLDIIKESVARMGGAPSKDWLERQEQLEQLSPDFDDLDSAFYEAAADLDVLVVEYIKKNAKDFYFSGDIVIE